MMEESQDTRSSLHRLKVLSVPALECYLGAGKADEGSASFDYSVGLGKEV